MKPPAPESGQPPAPLIGDGQLVQSLFLTHMNVIRGFIRGLVRDKHLADDVLQETFLTITRKAGDFIPGTNFVRWACAVARLKVLEAIRKERGNLVYLSDEAIEALSASESVPEEEPRVDLLATCMMELPPSMKKVVDLRYQGDHKPGEIARLIGWTAEAVYVALSRARQLLRSCVEHKLEELAEQA